MRTPKTELTKANFALYSLYLYTVAAYPTAQERLYVCTYIIRSVEENAE